MHTTNVSAIDMQYCIKEIPKLKYMYKEPLWKLYVNSSVGTYVMWIYLQTGQKGLLVSH